MARPGVAAVVLALAVAALPFVRATAAAAQPRAPAAQPAPPSVAPDPLDRRTPRGTIAGFNLAVHREDFVAAAQYMQLTRAQRPNAEQLARDLTDLLDRYYVAPISALSDAPDGTASDGLPLDHERVVLTIGGMPVDIDLVRINDPQAGLIWLVSSAALERVPALHASEPATWLERFMPPALASRSVLGASLGRWIAWAGTLVVPFAALWLLSAVFIAVARRGVTAPTKRRFLDAWHARLRWLVILLVTLGIHLALVPFLGFSLTFRVGYSRVAMVVAVVVMAWLLWRFMALSFADARTMAQRRGRAEIRSLLLLAERVCKTILVLVAAFAFLTIAGVDTTTALAGVGIGGVAVALGAQKSVENLLGGVFLLTDRALAVGDVCSISNRMGVVEDITMRSVRLRTMEQTLLSVPAGLLSQSSLENFATRDKILMQSVLRLQYGTTAAQLRRVLAGIRELLDEHPDIETPTSRIRLVDFGVHAIELELFAYVLTPDMLKFLAVREELLLDVAALVEASGAAFSQPPLVGA